VALHAVDRGFDAKNVMWVVFASGGSCDAAWNGQFRFSHNCPMGRVRDPLRRQAPFERRDRGISAFEVAVERVGGEAIRSASELIDKLLEIEIGIKKERY
jgi:hypothetical protein